jgi:hypothetical protein
MAQNPNNGAALITSVATNQQPTITVTANPNPTLTAVAGTDPRITATAVDPATYTQEEQHIPQSTTLGYVPIGLRDDQNLGHQWFKNPFLPAWLQPNKSKSYRAQEYSTIAHLLQKNPKEFGKYRQDVIGAVQKFNNIYKGPAEDPDKNAKLLAQLAQNAEYFAQYATIYSELYPGLLDKQLFNKIATDNQLQQILDYLAKDAAAQEKQLLLMNDIKNEKIDLIRKMLAEMPVLLANAQMYDGVTIGTSASGGIAYNKEIDGKNTTLLEINSVALETGGGFKVTFKLGDNLDNKGIAEGLNHMAEEISQRRIFCHGPKTLNPNMHRGQLLYLMNELIIGKGIKIDTNQFELLKETLLAAFPGSNLELDTLQRVNTMNNPFGKIKRTPEKQKEIDATYKSIKDMLVLDNRLVAKPSGPSVSSSSRPAHP